MSAAELHAELCRRGVRLIADGAKLRLHAPPGVLTDELRRRVKEEKDALLALVAQSQQEPGHAPAAAAHADDDTFPLTDVQEAYWVGRSGLYGSGGVSPLAYIEVEGSGLDLDRLERSWQQVIARHDMLRAVIVDGAQQVRREVPYYAFEREDLRAVTGEQVDARLAALRRERSRRVFPADRWPLFEIRALRMPPAARGHRGDGDARGDRLRLCISVDLLIADGMSVFVLIRDWGALYRGEALAPLGTTFRDYVLAEREVQRSAGFRESEAYWQARAATLPPAPELPHLQSHLQLGEPPRFVHRTVEIDGARWRVLQERARSAQLTPAGFLCAVYADVLARWSKSRRFTLNLTVSSRPPLHPEIDRVVGEFSSTLLLEADQTGATFAERARALGRQLTLDLDHARVSGVRTLRAMNRARASGDAALMPFVFTSHLGHWYGRSDSAPVAWLGELVYSTSQTPQVWLDHIVIERGHGLAVHWDAAENRFPPGLVDALCASYEARIAQLAEDAGAWDSPGRAPLPPAQLAARTRYNATSGPLPEGLLHTGFLDQAARDPEASAIAAPDRQIRYGELLRRANRLAEAVAEAGRDAGRDEVTGAGTDSARLVAVVMDKGWEQVVACLGVLIAGAAYLPIDPALPEERIHHLLDTGRVAVAVTTAAVAHAGFWPPQVRRVVVEDAPPAPGRYERAPASGRDPDDLAYVIFTSGSSGRPKGVSISHRGARNTIDDINRRFELSAEDRVLALSSLGFDLSVYDIFGTLAAGACVVLPRATAASDPAHWLARVDEEGVTVWSSVPALAELLADHVERAAARHAGHCKRLRLFLLSGDWIPVSLPDRLRAIARGARVISLGGATEASIWSIYYPVDAVDPAWTSVPYGRPLRNQTIHVLDQELAPCPDWVPGELYIGGAGLALGYWREPERTDAQFLHHPRSGERLYRTGDWGRFVPQGHVEFLGREDQQVKIAGYRIELGEIEAALLRHPAVRQAFASVAGETRDARRIVAHVVMDMEPGHGFDGDALRQALARSLPAYMIPAEVFAIDAVPYTSNGKVDRKQLLAMSASRPRAAGSAPAPDGASVDDHGAQAAPRTDSRARVRALVEGLLSERGAGPGSGPGPGLDDDEFDDDTRFVSAGITSIQLIKLASLLEEHFGHRPEMSELLLLDSVAKLARFYDEQRDGQRDAQHESGSTAARGSVSAANRDLGEPWPELFDPRRLAAFREERRGRRRFATGAERLRLRLDGPPIDSALRERYLARRSHRSFAQTPVAQTQLGGLLSALRAIEIDGKPKYLYASAHDSRSVQVYALVKPGRVSGLAGGAYYHDPIAHELVTLTLDDTDWRDAYVLETREIYAQAAFALFFVVALDAIVPLHGRHSIDYALIEAGLIAQLLETTAPELSLGLCQSGHVDFSRMSALFALDAQHVLLHSMLGGAQAWDEGTL